MISRILAALCIAAFFLGNTALAQEEVDALYLHNGSKILGTIIEMIPDKHVVIRMYDGSEMVYTIDQVQKIRKEEHVRSAEAAHDAPRVEEKWYYEERDRDLLHAAYTELGGNFGTPAGLNVAVGRWFGAVGTRLSGMLYPDLMAGLQFNLGVKLSDNSSRSHVLAAIAGVSSIEDDDAYWYSRTKTWNYIGAAYELNLYGFFLQAGLSVGEGDYSSPQLLFQLGYMYRFLPD